MNAVPAPSVSDMMSILGDGRLIKPNTNLICSKLIGNLKACRLHKWNGQIIVKNIKE